MTQTIIGIRFQRVGKIYHFNATRCPDVKIGDFVVVETSRGQQIGEVMQLLEDPPNPKDGGWKPIIRIATPRDLVLRQVWEYKEKEAIETCRAKSRELNLEGIKIVAAEYTFDGKRLTILYNSEANEGLELTGLRNTMKKHFRRTRVDFRQIGPRDVAKYIGGMGACGMANRCCSKFLLEFSPISIRMAKEQGVSLAPTEITGICGRLRCCLFYEYEHYKEARKELPRERKRIDTPLGSGKVISVSPLIKTVLVDLGEGGMKEFTLDELEGKAPEPEEVPEPTPQPETEAQDQNDNRRKTRINRRKRSKNSRRKRK